MESKSRTLEITILSGEDLRICRKNVKKNTYVVVRTDHLNSRSTKIDTEGGSYPFWNQKLIIDMPLRESFLAIEVYSKAASRDAIIGSISMPIADFTGGYIPANYLNFLSYRLRDPRGERNGIINLSVKVISPEYSLKRPETSCTASLWTAAPTIPSGYDKNFGIVTGVPVWGSNQKPTSH